MKKYRLYQVDAFTKTKFCGNSAGVVSNADGLTEEQMQKIAREVNASETAFVFSGDGTSYDFYIRFFTPLKEVPVCGHATIAAQYVLAIEHGITERKTVIQKTGAGLLPIEIIPKNGDYEIIMTQGAFSVSNLPSEEYQEKIRQALGVPKTELREDCPVVIASTGHGKVMFGIKERDVLNQLTPDMERLKQLSEEIQCGGYYVFVLTPKEKAAVNGRMFGPAVGVPEDPVTGNANGPLGGYLYRYGLIKPEKENFSFHIVQGEAMGRKGGMEVQVHITDGKPDEIKLKGSAVVVFQSELEL